MGIGSYFKTEKKPSSQSAPQTTPDPSPAAHNARHHSQQPSMASEPELRADLELHPPTPRYSSRPQSISGRSVKSTGSSVLDDIKHEVMVNYLYQQQCSHLWVSDGSGEIEGVLLRKARGQYMACPPQLGNSPFAMACAALNVQVCFKARGFVFATE
jgi:hypothetical protein